MGRYNQDILGWILTIPVSAAIGALVYYLLNWIL